MFAIRLVMDDKLVRARLVAKNLDEFASDLSDAFENIRLRIKDATNRNNRNNIGKAEVRMISLALVTRGKVEGKGGGGGAKPFITLPEKQIPLMELGKTTTSGRVTAYSADNRSASLARKTNLALQALENTLGLRREKYSIRVAGVADLDQALKQLYKIDYIKNVEKPPPPHLAFGFAIGADRTIVYRVSGGPGTVGHELVHLIVFNQLPTTPVWFEEALASLFEEYRIDNGKIIGTFRLAHWRMRYLGSRLGAGPFDIDRLPPIANIAWRNQRHKFLAGEEPPMPEVFSSKMIDQATAKMFAMFLQERGKLRSVVQALGHQELENNGLDTELAVIRKAVGDDYEKQFRTWLDRKLKKAGARTIKKN